MLAYIIAAWGSKSKPLCTGAETTCLAELISPTRLSKLLYLFATCPNLLAVILLFLNIVQRLLWLCALVFSSTSMVVCLKRPNTSNEVSLSCWRHIDTSFSNPISAFGIDFLTVRKLVFFLNIQAQQKLIAFGCVPATRFFLFGILFNLRKCKFRKCKGKSDKIRAWWNKRKKILFASLNNKCLACFRLKSQSLWHLFACSPVMHCFVASKHVIKSCKESINPKKKAIGEKVLMQFEFHKCL